MRTQAQAWRFYDVAAVLAVAALRDAGLALHDAQSAIAREHGFQSSNALREHVEERSLSFAAAVDEFAAAPISINVAATVR